MPLPLFAGRYQLEELLGQGGMGMVYRATDRRTGGTVAVKVISRALAAEPEYLERLRREARITASLTSPRVVRVIDLDEHDGAPFLVLEYVAGPTLDQLLDEWGPFPVHEAVTICLEVARALDAAYARGIVHRDLKPQNIKLVDGQVKVLDFGIARVEGEGGVTITGTYFGTPHYSAPERIAGRVDIRSDIYAVGAILFELLSGERPFDGPTPVAILMQHATAPLPELPASLPPAVRALVSRCLAKSPADRYQTPGELAAALAAVLRALPGAGAALMHAAPPVAAERERPAPTIAGRGLLRRQASTVATPAAAGSAAPSPSVPDLTPAAPGAPGAAPPAAARRGHRAVAMGHGLPRRALAGAGLAAAAAVAAAVFVMRYGNTTPNTPPPIVAYHPASQSTRVTTLAGSGETGVADGPGHTARFVAPMGVAVDGAGMAFVVDGGRIRRVSPAGEVVTLAGAEESGFIDGPAALARFNSPKGIAVDGSGTLYIANRENHRIRTLSPDGVVRTLAGTGTLGLADGPGDRAEFHHPSDVAVDAAGSVYVADAGNNRIRRISREGVVTTLAGGGDDSEGPDGPATLARFSSPSAVTVDNAGNLYVLDLSSRIRAISPGGEVTTLAGSGKVGFADGPAESAQFDEPGGIVAAMDGRVLIADTDNRRLRVVPALP